MSTSFWLDESKPQNSKKNYDVVIIGGGISGFSAAFWLQKEDPSLKIAIVEKNRMGFGASGRNAGFVTCGSVEHLSRMIHKHGEDEALEIWRFSEANLKLLQEHIVQDRAEEIEFKHGGSFSLAATESEFNELQKTSQIMKAKGIGVEVLSGEETSVRLGTSNFVGGVKYLDDASTNPIGLLKLMREKVKCDLFESTEVYDIEETSDGLRQVLTDRGTFNATFVVAAMNGYLPSLKSYFADKVYPTRGQILVTEPVPRFMEGPCYANFYLDYFRQLDSGHLLIGGFRQLEKETEVGYSDHITDTIQGALYQFTQTHLPKFKDCKVLYRWGGIMGFSKDGQPQVGSLADDPQFYFMGAYTGHGMGLAFNTGKSLADLVFGRDVPRWLSARRFQ